MTFYFLSVSARRYWLPGTTWSSPQQRDSGQSMRRHVPTHRRQKQRRTTPTTVPRNTLTAPTDIPTCRNIEGRSRIFSCPIWLYSRLPSPGSMERHGPPSWYVHTTLTLGASHTSSVDNLHVTFLYGANCLFRSLTQFVSASVHGHCGFEHWLWTSPTTEPKHVPRI